MPIGVLHSIEFYTLLWGLLFVSCVKLSVLLFWGIACSPSYSASGTSVGQEALHKEQFVLRVRQKAKVDRGSSSAVAAVMALCYLAKLMPIYFRECPLWHWGRELWQAYEGWNVFAPPGVKEGLPYSLMCKLFCINVRSKQLLIVSPLINAGSAIIDVSYMEF